MTTISKPTQTKMGSLVPFIDIDLKPEPIYFDSNNTPDLIPSSPPSLLYPDVDPTNNDLSHFPLQYSSGGVDPTNYALPHYPTNNDVTHLASHVYTSKEVDPTNNDVTHFPSHVYTFNEVGSTNNDVTHVACHVNSSGEVDPTNNDVTHLSSHVYSKEVDPTNNDVTHFPSHVYSSEEVDPTNNGVTHVPCHVYTSEEVDPTNNDVTHAPCHVYTSEEVDPTTQTPTPSSLDSTTGAIVPVPDLTTDIVSANPARKYPKRSNELVRVTNLNIGEERHFRDVVRKTRMLYDSLCIHIMHEEGRHNGPVLGRRAVRSDLGASTLMRDRGLWLNRDKRIVGSIPGVYIGDVFYFRMELCVVGLHGHPQAGIDYLPSSQSSNGEPIATSVIVSGGYEDDEDSGDVLVYTGHGGLDKFQKMCNHQKLEGGNLALERSMHYGIEIRVIRGLKYEGSLTTKVYVYDGLYRIVESWFDVGKSGFGVYKFKLVRIDGQPEMGSALLKFAHSLRTQPLEVRPMGYLSLDLSSSNENVPVLLYNDIDSDNDPLFYDYLVKTVFPPFVYAGGNTGCQCVGSCSDTASGCGCAGKNGGEIAYDNNGFLLKGKPLVFECGPHCSCPPSCRNRMSQKGLRNKLEVFRSMETGWSVRTLDLIHAGAFICEYAGVVLTKDQAQLFSMDGDSLIYPGWFADKWTEWGDLSQVFQDYVRPSDPPLSPLGFAMDVSRMRNVACYISHSTSPNVMVQFVLYDHSNTLFPHLMLFAMENIPPMRELSLDYGVPD